MPFVECLPLPEITRADPHANALRFSSSTVFLDYGSPGVGFLNFLAHTPC